jgi:hypothetical protein
VTTHILDVTYLNVWKVLAQNHSWTTYHLIDGAEKVVWTGDKDHIYRSRISDADDLADWTTNFSGTSIVVSLPDDAQALIIGLSGLKPVQVQEDGVTKIAWAPTKGSDAIIVTHNFCDQCTWYGESTRITDNTLTDSGDGLTFTSGDPFWIDIYSGRIPQDDQVSASQGSHGYLVEVKVDSVVQTMDASFVEGVDDYYVKWETGEVVFKVSQAGKTVTASYSKSSGDSTYTMSPPSNEVWNITRGETDFSKEVHMKDQFVYGAFGPVEVFAPHLTPDPYPEGTMIPLGAEDTYKRSFALALEASGNFPPLNKIGASSAELGISTLEEFRRKSRGMWDDAQAMQFIYEAVTQINGSLGMVLRIWLKNHEAYGGENAFVGLRVMKEDV